LPAKSFDLVGGLIDLLLAARRGNHVGAGFSKTQ
jgi:hypothetical protein